MCVLCGQGLGFLVLWLPNPRLAERKWWGRRPCGEWPEDAEDSWTIKRDLCLGGCPGHSQRHKSLPEGGDKRCRNAGSCLLRRNVLSGTFPLDSCRAGDLPGAPEACPSRVFPRAPGTGFLAPQPAQSRSTLPRERSRAWLNALLTPSLCSSSLSRGPYMFMEPGPGQGWLWASGAPHPLWPAIICHHLHTSRDEELTSSWEGPQSPLRDNGSSKGRGNVSRGMLWGLCLLV